MWRFLRPDAVAVLSDRKARASLTRYFDVVGNKRRAKFMIARRLTADFDEDDPTRDLWRLHDDLTAEYCDLERRIDEGGIDLGGIAIPERSYLDLKIEIAKRILKSCHFCVRRCGVNRLAGELGFCRCGAQILVSSMFHHLGEEPELVPSGTIFTMGCSMRCLHCQNWSICVSGETAVLLGDGSLRDIEDLVKENMADGTVKRAELADCADADINVLSIGPSLKVEVAKCSGVSKRVVSELYRIKTSAGREIVVTPNHPFFTCQDGKMIGTPAFNLREGDFVATLRAIRIENLAGQGSKRGSAEAVSASLARFAGYLMGGGHVGGKAIVFTSPDDDLVNDYARCCKDLFGAIPSIHSHKGLKRATLHSAGPMGFLERLAPEAIRKPGDREVPGMILRSDGDAVASFLRSYFDCKATIRARSREVDVRSSSRRLLQGIQALLLKLGILSQLCRAQGGRGYKLVLSGVDIIRFSETVGFLSSSKRRGLERLMGEGLASRMRADIIPHVGDLLRGVRERLRLSRREIRAYVKAYDHYEDRGSLPREAARRLLTVLTSRLAEIEARTGDLDGGADWRVIRRVRRGLRVSQRELASLLGVSRSLIGFYELRGSGGARILKRASIALREAGRSIVNDRELRDRLGRLRSITESDILWEKVISIDRIREERAVYDLRVEGTHNFIANLFVVHNSQWFEAGEPFTPKRLARAVDRLRQGGCRNANLVGGEPTPWTAQWLETFRHVSDNVPVVWNSNSYYSEETAKLLAGFADVYLLDFKYGPGDRCAERISAAPRYWEACTRNHLYAKRYGELIIRILVLPEHLECCLRPIVSWIADSLGTDTRVNIMHQYRPEWRAHEIRELRRRLNAEERRGSIAIAIKAGLTNLVPP